MLSIVRLNVVEQFICVLAPNLDSVNVPLRVKNSATTGANVIKLLTALSYDFPQ